MGEVCVVDGELGAAQGLRSCAELVRCAQEGCRKEGHRAARGEGWLLPMRSALSPLPDPH